MACNGATKYERRMKKEERRKKKNIQKYENMSQYYYLSGLLSWNQADMGGWDVGDADCRL